MLVTHDMLEKSTPVCIAFNHRPWHYLAVARLDTGGQRKYFIWKTDFKKRFEWDGSFNAQGGEMLRITLNMLHDAGDLSLPKNWKPGDEDDGQPPAWFELKQEAEQHRAEVAAQARQQTAKTAIYTFSRENEDGTRTTVRVRAANQTVAREALSQTFLNRVTLCTVQDGERYEL